jgi:hypothetical protein
MADSDPRVRHGPVAKLLVLMVALGGKAYRQPLDLIE